MRNNPISLETLGKSTSFLSISYGREYGGDADTFSPNGVILCTTLPVDCVLVTGGFGSSNLMEWVDNARKVSTKRVRIEGWRTLQKVAPFYLRRL